MHVCIYVYDDQNHQAKFDTMKRLIFNLKVKGSILTTGTLGEGSPYPFHTLIDHFYLLILIHFIINFIFLEN